MKSSNNTPETATCPTACYRLDRLYLVVGIVGTLLFLAMDIGSVCVAYWNVDGSFKRPKLAAIVYGVFWSCWTVVGPWMIVAYFRERLFVTAEAITQHGCVRKKTIQLSDVVQVVWKHSLPCVIVQGHVTRIKIHLGNFTSDEQDRLIAQLHSSFALEIQKNWTDFIDARRQPRLRRIPTKSRVTAAICALFLFSFGGIFGCFGVYGGSVPWLIVGVLNALVGLWYLWRIVRWHR